MPGGPLTSKPTWSSTHKRSVLVADPFLENPMGADSHYEVSLDRVVGAILLGVLTHEANLLMIEPGTPRPVDQS